MAPNELIGEVRILLKNGQIPDRVSNRLLWAAFAEHHKQEVIHWAQLEKNTGDIKWLKRGFWVAATGIIALAASVIT